MKIYIVGSNFHVSNRCSCYFLRVKYIDGLRGQPVNVFYASSSFQSHSHVFIACILFCFKNALDLYACIKKKT